MTRLKKVQLKGSKFSLTRESDGAGDSGCMWLNIDVQESLIQEKYVFVGNPGEVRAGCAVRCGSTTARTMQWQDWWQTTEILEILDVNKEKTECRFKTRNSIYIARGSND